ncbi:MAG: hypothetical protein ABI823_10755 [Bryobacteraceae bacterium]
MPTASGTRLGRPLDRVDFEDSRWLGYGQGIEKDGISKSEDRGIRPDSEREGKYGNKRKSPVAGEGPKTVADIL